MQSRHVVCLWIREGVHAPFFLTSHSSATRHQWLNLFSTRHECFTSDVSLTRTRLVSCILLTSLLYVRTSLSLSVSLVVRFCESLSDLPSDLRFLSLFFFFSCLFLNAKDEEDHNSAKFDSRRFVEACRAYGAYSQYTAWSRCCRCVDVPRADHDHDHVG